MHLGDEFIMKYIILLVSLLFGNVCAGPLLDTIKDIRELNTLNSIIRTSKNLTALFTSAKDFTFLAPSDDALGKWFAEGDGNNAALLEEKLLRYHLLQGRITTEELSDIPKFQHSFMNSTKFTNVTGGQVVELVKRKGEPIIISGNNTISKLAIPVDRVCTGGYLQVINSVLELPLNLIDSLSQSGDLGLFIAILNTGGFVNQDESPFIKKLLRASDITYFAPNTPKALASMGLTAKDLTEEGRSGVFGYHLVSGLVFSSDLKNGMKLKTLQGGELTVRVLEGVVYVNAARVLETDYLIGNGVMHTVDDLLSLTNLDPPIKPIELAPSHETKTTGLDGTTTVGIVVGVLTVVVFAVALLFLVNRRRKMQTIQEEYTTRVIDGKAYGQEERTGYVPPQEHHQQQYTRRPQPRDDIELEASNYQSSLTPSQKKWEYEVNAVELDGTDRR